MGALLLGAVFAKVISTASNYLFSPATNLVEDVFVRYVAPGASNKRVLSFRGWRWCCWAAGRSTRRCMRQSILDKMLYAYTIYSAALTPVVLAAFYSKRATAWGAVAAIATGTVVTLAWDAPGVKEIFPPILAQRDAIFPALFAAVARWLWSARLRQSRRRSSLRALRSNGCNSRSDGQPRNSQRWMPLHSGRCSHRPVIDQLRDVTEPKPIPCYIRGMRVYVLACALMIAVTVPVSGQECPQSSAAGPDFGSVVRTLEGRLVFHDGIRKWFELKLYQPQCSQASIELVPGNSPRLQCIKGLSSQIDRFDWLFAYWLLLTCYQPDGWRD